MSYENYISQKAFEQINWELIRKNKKVLPANIAPLDEETRTRALGAVGEKLVRWYITTVLGTKIIESFDPMDSEKDFVFATGETAEIKTQSPYFNLQAFAVRSDQYKKLKNVDHIYFVETPRAAAIPYSDWNFNARQRFVNGPFKEKNATHFVATVYHFSKSLRNISEIVEKKTVYAQDGRNRDMLLIPIKHLTPWFEITMPKHLVLLDKYSTNPIGLFEPEDDFVL